MHSFEQSTHYFWSSSVADGAVIIVAATAVDFIGAVNAVVDATTTVDATTAVDAATDVKQRMITTKAAKKRTPFQPQMNSFKKR